MTENKDRVAYFKRVQCDRRASYVCAQEVGRPTYSQRTFRLVEHVPAHCMVAAKQHLQDLGVSADLSNGLPDLIYISRERALARARN